MWALQLSSSPAPLPHQNGLGQNQTSASMTPAALTGVQVIWYSHCSWNSETVAWPSAGEVQHHARWPGLYCEGDVSIPSTAPAGATPRSLRLETWSAQGQGVLRLSPRQLPLQGAQLHPNWLPRRPSRQSSHQRAQCHALWAGSSSAPIRYLVYWEAFEGAAFKRAGRLRMPRWLKQKRRWKCPTPVPSRQPWRRAANEPRLP